VVGGGKTLLALSRFGVRDRVSRVSTGGPAMLESLEGSELPGVQVLQTKRTAASRDTARGRGRSVVRTAWLSHPGVEVISRPGADLDSADHGQRSVNAKCDADLLGCAAAIGDATG
jgi:hypothetical protein